MLKLQSKKLSSWMGETQLPIQYHSVACLLKDNAQVKWRLPRPPDCKQLVEILSLDVYMYYILEVTSSYDSLYQHNVTRYVFLGIIGSTVVFNNPVFIMILIYHFYWYHWKVCLSAYKSLQKQILYTVVSS